MHMNTEDVDSGKRITLQFEVAIDAVQMYWLQKTGIDELVCIVDAVHRRLIITGETIIWDG